MSFHIVDRMRSSTRSGISAFVGCLLRGQERRPGQAEVDEIASSALVLRIGCRTYESLNLFTLLDCLATFNLSRTTKLSF